MRRQFIVHPQFQLSFTISFVVGTIIIIGGLGLTAVASLFLLGQSDGLSPDQKADLVVGAAHISIFIAGITLVALIFFSLMGLYFSYKLVGPLNRIETWLSAHINGQAPAPIKLRPRDELASTVDLLNILIVKHSGALERNK